MESGPEKAFGTDGLSAMSPCCDTSTLCVSPSDTHGSPLVAFCMLGLVLSCPVLPVLLPEGFLRWRGPLCGSAGEAEGTAAVQAAQQCCPLHCGSVVTDLPLAGPQRMRCGRGPQLGEVSPRTTVHPCCVRGLGTPAPKASGGRWCQGQQGAWMTSEGERLPMSCCQRLHTWCHHQNGEDRERPLNTSRNAEGPAHSSAGNVRRCGALEDRKLLRGPEPHCPEMKIYIYTKPAHKLYSW